MWESADRFRCDISSCQLSNCKFPIPINAFYLHIPINS